MARTKYLDQGQDTAIADQVLQQIESDGYTAEEAIPGLIQAVILLAEASHAPEEYLDEAANILADGPSVNEMWGV